MTKKIQWLQKFDNERADSIWYGDDIVTIIFDDRYFCTITAIGDITADIKGKRYCDKSNSGRFKEYLFENGIYNDEDLQKAIENNDITFTDNNWFEFFWLYNKYLQADILRFG